MGVPQYEAAPIGFSSIFGGNITLTGGPAPARAYIETLMPAILDGTVRPGKVFDRSVDLDGVPEGYRAMAAREALKVLSGCDELGRSFAGTRTTASSAMAVIVRLGLTPTLPGTVELSVTRRFW